MNVRFDEKQLLQLITNLYILTGMAANILDPQGRDIRLFQDHPPFCRAVNANEEGHRRCVNCDAWKVRHYTAEKGFQFYRCHAGICEAVMPLYDKNRPLAYLIFGCFLDASPIERQWQASRALLDWYPGGPDRLREAFFQLRQYSEQELRAYAELLHIGRTKLCALAKELSGGRTLSYLIAQRRINAAKLLLLQSSLNISAVAEEVGISDYNYFSKVFRSITGVTPSDFRRGGHDLSHEKRNRTDL